MSAIPRTFTVAPGRRLVLPRALGTAPGGEHAAYAAGESFTVATVDRFLRLRLAAGDITEAKPAPTRPSKET